jgi:hypothetical protein
MSTRMAKIMLAAIGALVVLAAVALAVSGDGLPLGDLYPTSKVLGPSDIPGITNGVHTAVTNEAALRAAGDVQTRSNAVVDAAAALAAAAPSLSVARATYADSAGTSSNANDHIADTTNAHLRTWVAGDTDARRYMPFTTGSWTKDTNALYGGTTSTNYYYSLPGEDQSDLTYISSSNRWYTSGALISAESGNKPQINGVNTPSSYLYMRTITNNYIRSPYLPEGIKSFTFLGAIRSSSYTATFAIETTTSSNPTNATWTTVSNVTFEAVGTQQGRTVLINAPTARYLRMRFLYPSYGISSDASDVSKSPVFDNLLIAPMPASYSNYFSPSRLWVVDGKVVGVDTNSRPTFPGANLTGNLNMGGNSITNVGTNSIEFVNGTRLSTPAPGVLAINDNTNTYSITTIDAIDAYIDRIYSYPVFTLDLGGSWTDFELKASTNNFTNLCYYIMSHGTNEFTTDTNAWVYFTDDYSPDVRVWRKATLANTIRSQLVDGVNSEVERVIVLPSHEAQNWQNWMSKTNDRLVWSYVRYDGIGFETNRTGTWQHWNPVVPTEWRRSRTSP